MPYSMAAAGIVSMVPAAIKLATGNKQRKQADAIRKNNPRPIQEVNPYVAANLALAKNRASTNMPGYGNYLNQIGNNAAGGTYMATQAGQDPNAILGTIAAINDNSNKAVGDLNVSNAQYRDRGYTGLLDANNAMAADEKARFDWNSKQKYLDAMAAASALEYGALQNKYGAVNDIAKGAMGMMGALKNPGDSLGTPTNPGATPAGANNSVAAPTSAASAEQSFAKIQQANPDMTPDQVWSMVQAGITDPDLAYLFMP